MRLVDEVPDDVLAEQEAERFGPSPVPVLPHDDDAERATIGAALVSTTARTEALGIIGPADFYRPAHALLWTAIGDLHGRGEGVDALTVAAELERRGTLDEAGGKVAVVDIEAATLGTANVATYARIVADLAARRALMRAADTLKSAARSGKALPDALDRLDTARRAIDAAGRGKAATRHAGALLDWSSVFEGTADDDWLIGPLLARGRSHSIYGPAKSRKSLVLVALAAAAASGRAVLDRTTGAPLSVLYFDLEMTGDDVRERLADMAYGPDDLAHLHYYSLPDLPPLDTAQGGVEVVELVRAHGADLVVFDTLSRVLEGEENSADTLRGFYAHTGRPLKAEGVTVVRADHTGKDVERGARGTSAKADDIDVAWRVTPRDADRLTLTATHRRMSWVPDRVELAILADPLRFTLATGTWPAGTSEAAALLDRLQVPTDVGRSRARDAIREAGEKVSNDALAAALRYRRTTPKEVPDAP